MASGLQGPDRRTPSGARMTRLLPWDERPALTGSIINPALVGATVAWCVARYAKEAPTGMPWELCYLVPPLVLHHESRQALPTTARTHLSSWVGSSQSVLVGFADRVMRFRAHVDEGLRFGLRAGLLSIDSDAHMHAHIPASAKVGTVTELDEILRAAATLGAVLGRAGSSINVYTLFGVSP